MIKQFRDTEYFISDDGKVYSNKIYYMYEMKLQENNKNKYIQIIFHLNSKPKSFYVHRLVAECFLENYSEKLQVNHKDFNKHNNKIENLEMVTQKENMQHYKYNNGINVEENMKKCVKEYYIKNKEKIKKYQKDYRLKMGKDKIMDYWNKYKLTNKEKIKKYQKEYYIKNKRVM